MILQEEISPEEFPNEESPVHGRAHMHRVMFWVDKICIAQGLGDLRGDAIAAARIHDIARTHDGACLVHGARAAALLPEYESFLKETFGMTNPGAVEYACSVHCLPCPLDRDHPYFLVAAILRDADALDRYRLSHDGPNPNWLHFERTPHFLKAAKELARQTVSNDTPLATIRELGEKISNPAKNARLTCPDQQEVAKTETPRETRNRRLKQGQFGKHMEHVVEMMENQPIINMADMLCRALNPGDAAIIKKEVRLAQYFASQFRVASFFNPDGWAGFLETKTTKTLWDTGATWHTKYAGSEENALDIRAYNDQRLWGEKGHAITYGSLLPPQAPAIEDALKNMYGKHKAEWLLKNIEGFSSFCQNDSQETPFCLPCELFEETVIRTVIRNRHEPWAQALSKKCPPPWEKPFKFFEIQIHKRMNLDEVFEGTF